MTKYLFHKLHYIIAQSITHVIFHVKSFAINLLRKKRKKIRAFCLSWTFNLFCFLHFVCLRRKHKTAQQNNKEDNAKYQEDIIFHYFFTITRSIIIIPSS